MMHDLPLVLIFKCPRCREPFDADAQEVGQGHQCRKCEAEIRKPIDAPAGNPGIKKLRRKTRNRLPASLIAALLTATFVTSACYRAAPSTPNPAVPSWSPVTPQSSGEVTIQYDGFKNVTRASIGGIKNGQWKLLVSNGDGTYKSPLANIDYGYYAEFDYSYDGSALQNAPPLVFFELTNYDPDIHMAMPTDFFFFLIDGQRASAKIFSSQPDDATVEIPIDLAITLANAHSVEIEAGSEQFKLTDHELQGLRDFLAALGFQGVSHATAN
jgi:hypothetical protein